MLVMLIRLSLLSLGLASVTCTSTTQTQLASLNERLSQVLNTLYSTPLLSNPAATEVEEVSNTSSPDTSYILTSGPPQVVYVSSAPYLEQGAQPNDFGYSAETHPVTRSAWPYPSSTPPAFPQNSQKYSYPWARPYSDVQRFLYPQPSPGQAQPAYPSPATPAPPSFPSPHQYSLPYSSPLLYPTPIPSYPTSPSQASPFSQSYSSTPLPPFPPASPFSYPLPCSPQVHYPSLPPPSFPHQVNFPSQVSPSFSTLPSPPCPPSSFSPNFPSFPSQYPTFNTFGGFSFPSYYGTPYSPQPTSKLLHQSLDFGR